ncbi:MAG: ATP-binding cassette domain-containing protein [Chloroflexi bacterium]|nr:MAG: ATP-binding cassette domain-containing protein [Chloroflexota bacterium]MBL1196457.1 ATP-binding cassette domain-containing protein [Chloroflexota bacterium]NOH13752.1 ATP-binding cassette domain-containing protein [Chloroflexota bacterium]
MKPLLKVTNLSKRFGTLSALRNIDLEIQAGEVVGIAGQSGSGKSTLAMLLAGYLVPDQGELYFAGRRIHWPFQVRSLDIEVIYQTPILAENLDITSMIFLGNELGWSLGNNWFKIPNQLKMDQEATRILDQLGVTYKSLREKVSNLSGEKRQMIAVAKAMSSSPRMIIIDDPARTLSYPYQQTLLALVQEWQKQGIGVLFASNNLEDLLATTDRIIVLRKGYRAAEFRTQEAEREQLIAAMVGTTDYEKLTPIIWALDSYYRAREDADRMQRSQLYLEKEQIDLDSLRHKLIDHLTEQVTILDSSNQALQNAQRRLLTELEKERKHLAREIHDQIIQDLLSTNYQIEEIEAHEDSSPAMQENLINLRNNLRNLIDELRNICSDLRPPTIDSLGIVAALQSYSHEWAKRTNTVVNLNLDKDIARMSETVELSIYRIVQEGLNNIQKHAEATQVDISLQHASPRALMVSIADNGKGIIQGVDTAQLAHDGHYGLLGISERVALLGGRLRFQNQENGGLVIQAEIPYSSNKSAAKQPYFASETNS